MQSLADRRLPAGYTQTLSANSANDLADRLAIKYHQALIPLFDELKIAGADRSKAGKCFLRGGLSAIFAEGFDAPPLVSLTIQSSLPGTDMFHSLIYGHLGIAGYFEPSEVKRFQSARA